jgi:2-phospho-L-lactate/phosphoenolpyruvate guanylyltransferase
LNTGMPPDWNAIVPVKRPTTAKTRLGLTAGQRTRLAIAFAQDLVTAVVDTGVRRVVVVHDVDIVLNLPDGVELVGDPGAGLNAALRAGATRFQPDQRLLAVVADLPCATSAELVTLLDAADHLLSGSDPAPAAFLGDAPGLGTTALLARQTDFHPRFGPRSAARHRFAGAASVAAALPRLRRDVDSLVDLVDARRLGVGPATRAAIDELGLDA